MVTLRSHDKQAASNDEPNAAQAVKATTSRASGRTGRRSATPDRSSQDSGLRRSQRVKERTGALESIQEDTAASAEAKPALHRLAVASHPAELADIPEEAAKAPVVKPATTTAQAAQAVPLTRAQAVQHAILQASQASDSNAGLASDASAAEGSDEDTDSDADSDILAQLSANMWAALRPGAEQSGAQQQQQRTGTDAAASDRLQGAQPKNAQSAGDADAEEELHWQPETGLPEPLDAKACSSFRSAPGQAQLEKQFKLQPRDTRSIEKQARKLAPQTAGKQWFDLPAQQLTDETRRDLKLLQLRGTFDPKRFYKSSDHKKGLPKFFQIGTVVESAADFYSGRLSNKERKRTITEELLADPELSQARKRRFNKLQDEKAYWAKKKGRKTDLPRGKKTTRTRK